MLFHSCDPVPLPQNMLHFALLHRFIQFICRFSGTDLALIYNTEIKKENFQ